MTRKRYIKLTMAMGVQRDAARELAAAALADGMTYQDAYDRAQGMALALLLKKAIKETVPGAALIFGMSGGVPFIPTSMCRSIVEMCGEKPYSFNKPALPSLPWEGTTCR